jgi:hypothetical protein
MPILFSVIQYTFMLLLSVHWWHSLFVRAVSGAISAVY